MPYLTGNKAESVYLYEFSHALEKPSSTLQTYFGECAYTVCHGNEIPFVFDNSGTNFYNSSFTKDEAVLARNINATLSNFITTSNPNTGITLNLPTIPKYTAGSAYIHLDTGTSGSTLSTYAYAPLCTLWSLSGIFPTTNAPVHAPTRAPRSK